jgi:hypothetical protein
MALLGMFFSHRQENTQNSLRPWSVQIGRILWKMNMMLLLPTIPGTWCHLAPTKISLTAIVFIASRNMLMEL